MSNCNPVSPSNPNNQLAVAVPEDGGSPTNATTQGPISDRPRHFGLLFFLFLVVLALFHFGPLSNAFRHLAAGMTDADEQVEQAYEEGRRAYAQALDTANQGTFGLDKATLSIQAIRSRPDYHSNPAYNASAFHELIESSKRQIFICQVFLEFGCAVAVIAALFLVIGWISEAINRFSVVRS